MKSARVRRVSLVTAVILACLVLVAAGFGKKDEGGEDDGQPVVGEESKQTFEVETGPYFDFGLESNPTTCYSWQTAQAPDDQVVQLVNNYFAEPSSDVLGAPGEDVWQLRAVGAGSTTMVLEYSQAWDKETPPTKRDTLTLNVAQADKRA